MFMNRQEASKTMTLHTGVDLNTKANTMKKQVIKIFKIPNCGKAARVDEILHEAIKYERYEIYEFPFKLQNRIW